jgi:hypothetical protein
MAEWNPLLQSLISLTGGGLVAIPILLPELRVLLKL